MGLAGGMGWPGLLSSFLFTLLSVASLLVNRLLLWRSSLLINA